MLIRRISRDVARCRLKKPTRSGFTHGEIVTAICLKYALILFACAAQVLFVASFKSELLYAVDRYPFWWLACLAVLAAGLAVWAHGYWSRRDAAEPPTAPVTEPPGVALTEDLDVVRTIGPQARWLNVSLRLFSAIMGLPLLILPALMWWMHHRQALVALRWYAILILPYAVAAWVAWKFLERGIRRDMARSLRNEPLHNGIPHHGVLMVVSIKNLLALSIWVAQIIVTVKLNMEWECIVFGIANVLTDFLLIAAVLVIWRMERGWSNALGTGGDAGDFPPGAIVARISRLFQRTAIKGSNP
jgi:hypothetical protein